MFRNLGMMFAGLIAAMSLTGCPSANPVKPALESGKPELVALATAGSYAITQGVLLEIAKDPATPHDVQQKLIAVDEKAYPAVKKLEPAARLVQRVQSDLAAGKTPEEKIEIALKNLNGYLDEAAPLIQDVNKAVTDAKSGGGS